MIVNEDIVIVDGWQFSINRDIPKIEESFGKIEINDEINNLELDKNEIILGLTQQQDINIDNKAQIKVITQNISKNQYKWNILNKNIATIDFNGNIIAVSSGETTIECKSIDGKKIYATCNLIVEDREYIYYRGKSMIEFDNPICGSQGTLSGAPHFKEEYIYCNFSNVGHGDASQILNILSKNKIDFSKYKGVGINQKSEYTGIKPWWNVATTQERTCNFYGLISGEDLKRIVRENNYIYFDNTTCNEMAYLDIKMHIGEYLSNIETVADFYIYEIYLVKKDI